MRQEERWQTRYDEVVAFIKANQRNPSKYKIEEHLMLNWVKSNRKKMNAGELKEPRLSRFKKLLELAEEYKSKNQYK